MAVQLLSCLEDVGDIFGPWLHFGGGAARNKRGEKSLNFSQAGWLGSGYVGREDFGLRRFVDKFLPTYKFEQNVLP